MKISIDLEQGGMTIIDSNKIKSVTPYPEGSEIVMRDRTKHFALNRLNQKNSVTVNVDGLVGVKSFDSINSLVGI